MLTRTLAPLAAACVLGSWTTSAATGFASFRDAVAPVELASPPTDRSDQGPALCTPGTFSAISQSPNLPIPDGGALVLGPIGFPVQAGITIRDVVVGLEVEHNRVGDLVVTLMRVQGTNVVSVTLLDRPSYPQVLPFGCRADLRSAETNPVWFFGDGASAPMAEGSSCLPDGAAIPQGCYRVAPESQWRFSAYRGLETGGTAAEPARWYLVVRDDQAQQAGRIRSWSIHVLDQPTTSVDESSWGVVKSLYRD
jgi:subtilisin-like proprotein convertase family protein